MNNMNIEYRIVAKKTATFNVPEKINPIDYYNYKIYSVSFDNERPIFRDVFPVDLTMLIDVNGKKEDYPYVKEWINEKIDRQIELLQNIKQNINNSIIEETRDVDERLKLMDHENE